MSFEMLGLLLVISGAVPYTLFVVLYGWKARRVWWAWPTGRALMVSSTSTALLLDLTLLFTVVPVSTFWGQVITAIIVGLIAVGGWMKYGALLHESPRRARPPANGDH